MDEYPAYLLAATKEHFLYGTQNNPTLLYPAWKYMNEKQPPYKAVLC